MRNKINFLIFMYAKSFIERSNLSKSFQLRHKIESCHKKVGLNLLFVVKKIKKESYAFYTLKIIFMEEEIMELTTIHCFKI